MTGRTTLLVVFVAAVSAVGASQLGRDQAQPTSARLETRVNSYYTTLKNQRFEETWQFLSSGLRRDNPQEIYAKNLRGAQKGFDLIGAPSVSSDSAFNQTSGRGQVSGRTQTSGGNTTAKSTGGMAGKTMEWPADSDKTGRARALLKVTGLDGKPVLVDHTTFWKWGVVNSKPPDWYIVREEMVDRPPVTER